MASVIPFNTPVPEGVGLSLNGVMTAVSQKVLDDQASARDEAARLNFSPPVQGLAGHARKVWERNKRDKQNIEERMIRALRQRRGEYDPRKLHKIREQNQPEIYMMIAAAKARTITSWLREILMSQGTEKPWTLDPTPIPELSPDKVSAVFAELAEAVRLLNDQGIPLDSTQVRKLMETRKADLLRELKEDARRTVDRMELHMEDQLIEGGFMAALSEALDDLTTFPAMILKGPVIRNRPSLRWEQNAEGEWEVSQADVLRPEWERVDPFNLYPSPGMQDIDDGDLIELHRMTRSDLHALIGVKGYSEEAIRAVLDEHGRGGLHEWTAIDTERADAEGREPTTDNPSHTIDALQLWGSVQGQLLLDYGFTSEEIPDPLAEHEVELWLIGRWVIKAVLNADPLDQKPYFKTAWEKTPGAFWGVSPLEQIKDCESMANAAARALAVNLGVASGPQVWVNVDRLPPGENIESIYPLKIWQTTSDVTGGGSNAPAGFFQPDSNAQELMAVYEKFSTIADEVVGVPKYMSGASPGGGVGRTATGMSMLVDHAGKVMQQVVGLIDLDVLTPLLQRQYYYNMKHADDPSIKGDANVVARGSRSLVAKESAAQRRNEFLIATNNPTDLQITGLEGRAVVLREQAKALDLNVDRIVPDAETLRARQALVGLSQPPQPTQPATQNIGSGQTLNDGTPVEDSFQPAG